MAVTGRDPLFAMVTYAVPTLPPQPLNATYDASDMSEFLGLYWSLVVSGVHVIAFVANMPASAFIANMASATLDMALPFSAVDWKIR